MRRTTQSHKSTRRDKARHSAKTFAKSGGKSGGGRANWGRLDEVIPDNVQLDERDPMYVPGQVKDNEEEKILKRMSKVSKERTMRFEASARDLAIFKKAARLALKDYLADEKPDLFVSSIKDTQLGIYIQDLPAEIIKYSVASASEEKQVAALSHLLSYLAKDVKLVSARQITTSFRRVIDRMDDLVLDNPKADVIVKGYLEYCSDNDLITEDGNSSSEDQEQKSTSFGGSAVAQRLWAGYLLLKDNGTVEKIKKELGTVLDDLLCNHDQEAALKELKDLNMGPLAHQCIKMLVRKAMDHGPSEFEVASRMVATLSGGLVASSEVEKGFRILLERVEDIYLDVPGILHVLSVFIARAIADEALQQAFPWRVDLTEGDMGFEVAQQASDLLKNHQLRDFEICWVDVRKDDDY